MPERQREAAKEAEQARKGESERARTAIVALQQERDDLLAVRQEAEALRLQLADTARALEQETRKVATLDRFASEVITQDIRVISDLWVTRDLPPPHLTEAGKIDVAGVRGLSTEDIQRLDRLGSHSHGLIKTRIEERVRNKPAPSPQQVLEMETPDSLIAQGYGPARIPNEYLLPEQKEALEDTRRKLAAYDDLTLLRIGIVTWAVWAQARRAFDASRTVARITEGEKLKNGYDEIYKLLRARNLPVPSDARAQRPSQRPHGPGGYER
ncbi:MAG: hypothetical protein KJ904_14790 [Alphaproteobacteria bacterium]|nr:hypothetical protein [Alphaproteobacteria bacterium]MBU0798463.1 hypothetical protein [Alphaproteobacteria bacterium]MBU0888421.1 hypothetical protein [Alphaproteobacteria bacterium]MBU1814732.1 hypothetical protein [Alphaproteobacteria bacterium]MBU2091628.1 hypothetical protein [Alphaproteobacteria bacterium]